MVWLQRVPIKLKQSGFSIVEMVIVLGISIGLVTLESINLNTYTEELVLRNTTREIKSAIEQAARVSVINHSATLIRYQPVSRKITIFSRNYLRIIKVDSKIEIYNLSNLKISSNGTMPPHKIVITNHKKSTNLILQMTWGKIISESS